jgi:hypothetical protein
MRSKPFISEPHDLESNTKRTSTTKRSPNFMFRTILHRIFGYRRFPLTPSRAAELLKGMRIYKELRK